MCYCSVFFSFLLLALSTSLNGLAICRMDEENLKKMWFGEQLCIRNNVTFFPTWCEKSSTFFFVSWFSRPMPFVVRLLRAQCIGIICSNSPLLPVADLWWDIFKRMECENNQHTLLLSVGICMHYSVIDQLIRATRARLWPDWNVRELKTSIETDLSTNSAI